ncbi:hypothetical protein [Streptomyces sporangiiformans]|uniref:Uncharacterized protein n=1 Tax=Streptomyces sporangiiformans TaxID=2315329 RepID=A0A505DBZ3_9ACTN|nr:hypothetical protein [Streptomyces sporangiiformans]TPQ20377.1 hypothetical protein FGD71_020735 [Streptomyces sporangiiformans]
MSASTADTASAAGTARTAGTSRARLLAAAALSLATLTLTLTACDDGEGLRDEGPSATSAHKDGGQAFPVGAAALSRRHHPAATTLLTKR